MSPLVLAIPFVAAFIGWFTNLLAVRAVLYPVQFIGLPAIAGRQLIGWQGVIPANAETMSLDFSKLIREELLDLNSLFKELRDGNSERFEELVDEVTDKALHELATELAPQAWAKARDKLRDYIRALVRQSVKEVTTGIIDELALQADDLIDIDAIMVEAMSEDRSLMGRVIATIAHREFTFLEMSGLYFGFVFGVLQMLVWMVYPAFWVLPVAGFFVGYVTNWLALHLIFEPREAKKIGPFTLQGVFIKRRHEVAISFADVLCADVLNSENLQQHLQREPAREKIAKVLDLHVDKTLQSFEKDPMVAMLLGPDKLNDARADLQQRLRADESEGVRTMPDSLKHLIDPTAIIRDKLIESLSTLSASQFSSILRPVFQKDEWKLTVLGGVIGIAIGSLQSLFLFNDAL